MTLDEIHEAELYVLKRIDAICRKIGVKYWVLYGTLIGAVREHGIIPWDDDVDVGMMRSDYNKFIEYFIQEGDKIEGLHLDHMLTRKNYHFYIARVSETINSTSQVYESGLFVDIYPIDDVRVSEWSNWLKIYYRIHHGGVLSCWKNLKDMNIFRKIFIYAGLASVKIIRKLLWRFDLRTLCIFDAKLIDFLARRYIFSQNSEYCGVACWFPEPNTWKKSSFAETLYLKFEDFTVPVPVGYDEILRGTYGDYMQLPPPEQRQPHHNYIAYKP